MSTADRRQAILHALLVVPLLYVGQVRELILALHERTPNERQKGKQSYRIWKKKCRTIALELIADLTRTGFLAEKPYVKERGYFHRCIIQPEPLFAVPPCTAIRDIQGAETKLRAFLDEEIDRNREAVQAYYLRADIPRPAMNNPLYRETIKYVAALRGEVDRRGDLTIAAFRAGSIYVSQLGYRREDAASFHLTSSAIDTGRELQPIATINRATGPTELFVSQVTLAKRLPELSERQLRSSSWLEVW